MTVFWVVAQAELEQNTKDDLHERKGMQICPDAVGPQQQVHSGSEGQTRENHTGTD